MRLTIIGEGFKFHSQLIGKSNEFKEAARDPTDLVRDRLQ